MEILKNYEKLIKYKLNYNQVFYLYLISDNLLSALYKWQHESAIPITRDEVDHLYEMEYISEPWIGQYPDSSVITKKGKKILSLITEADIIKKDKIQENVKNWFLELFNVYPKYFGKDKFEAKSLKPSYLLDGNSIEGPSAYAHYYYNSIQSDETLHNTIIDKVKWAKNQNEPENSTKNVAELFSTLASFIVQKKWESITIKQEENRGI